MLAERIAEIPSHHTAEKGDVLLPDRPIELHDPFHRRPSLRRAAWTEHGRHGIPWDQAHQEKGEEGDQEENRDHEGEPAQDVAGHMVMGDGVIG